MNRFLAYGIKVLSSAITQDQQVSLAKLLVSQLSVTDRLRLGSTLLPELDRAENWNNDDPVTNGEYWLLKKVIPHCSLVCDVGAHVGNWTRQCLTENRDVQIYAFEASPRTAEIFAQKFGSLSNVHLFQIGVGDRAETLKFHDYGSCSGLSGFFSRERSVGKKPQRVIDVACTQLDQLPQLAGRSVDLLKIDTEGNEMAVLRGAESLLAEKRIRLIQFEYGGTWIDAREFLADAFHLLKRHGYVVGRLLPDDIQWVSTFDHRELELFKYSNFVACASEEDLDALGLGNLTGSAS